MDKQTALRDIDLKINGLKAHKNRTRQVTNDMTIEQKVKVDLEFYNAGYWPDHEDLDREITRLQEARKDVEQRSN